MSIQFRDDRPSPLIRNHRPGRTGFDRDYIVRFAQTHEAAGFDRLLVGHWSDQPDGFLVTALAGLSTEKISFLLAHRPDSSRQRWRHVSLPPEHLLGGRLAVHIISGGNDAEQRRDGDYLNHDQLRAYRCLP